MLDVPNLDACNPDELLEIETVALNVADYAKHKREAMSARLEGRIEAARVLEEKCDRIYKRIPEAYRW